MHSGTDSILARSSLSRSGNDRQGLGVSDQRFDFLFTRHAGEVIYNFLEFGEVGLTY